MEFNLSGFFTRVGIDVLNLNDLRNVLDDFNYSIELINFNDIDNFLLEEFSEFIVHFVIEFRILTGKLLHLVLPQFFHWIFQGERYRLPIWRQIAFVIWAYRRVWYRCRFWSKGCPFWVYRFDFGICWLQLGIGPSILGGLAPFSICWGRLRQTP